MNKINWKFIGTLEGRSLHGYVPNPTKSQSGVTIATGFDIGAVSDEAWPKLPSWAQQLFSHYRHLHGMAALGTVHAAPLSITEEQADELDVISTSQTQAILEEHYNAASEVKFWELPEAAQTVLASVTFQYGTPWVRCPKFWDASIKQDYSEMIIELFDFGDAYSTRRKAEAEYLEQNIS